MQKMFEINWTKIKGGCQSESKVVTLNSKSDLFLRSWRLDRLVSMPRAGEFSLRHYAKVCHEMAIVVKYDYEGARPGYAVD